MPCPTEEFRLKVQDSGMPEQVYWDSLFDIEAILQWLECSGRPETVVEIGCGYGTFTVPVATAIKGRLISFDIEQSMLAITRANADEAGVSNVELQCRDVLANGTGLQAGSVDRVMLFNILHFPERHQLLVEVARILKPGGRVDILHWRKDISTPRGPQVDSRPDTPMVLHAIEGADLVQKGEACILPPYHWGLQLIKPSA